MILAALAITTFVCLAAGYFVFSLVLKKGQPKLIAALSAAITALLIFVAIVSVAADSMFGTTASGEISNTLGVIPVLMIKVGGPLLLIYSLAPNPYRKSKSYWQESTPPLAIAVVLLMARLVL